jgi:2-C-methyl-D-erythritol 4-phosphate cytidylyltransferase
VFLLPQAYLAFPLFGFVLVLLGYIGAHLAMSKRESVLALFGERAGLAPRTAPLAALPRVVDTSVAVDGRVLDIVRAGFLHGVMLVPSPVLAELQGLATPVTAAAHAGPARARGAGGAAARGRRHRRGARARRAGGARGGRQARPHLPGPRRSPAHAGHQPGQGGRPGRRAGAQPARPVAGAAAEGGCRRRRRLLLLKPGKEPDQAVGYLDDGSMVVVEGGRTRVGSEISVRVTSVLTTANGRLVFARPAETESAPAPRAARVPRAVPRPPAAERRGAVSAATPERVGALVPAAGSGVRLGPGDPKALRLLAGEPLLVHAVRGLRAAPSVGAVVVAAPPADVDEVRDLLAPYSVEVVPGGAERQDSVRRALAALDPAVELVLVHDAARCLTPRLAGRGGGGGRCAPRGGASVPVLPVADTVKAVDGDRVTARRWTAARCARLRRRRGFRRAVLERAHASGLPVATDDAGLVEADGGTVTTVDGSRTP